ncbi:MAG: hypothetical protein MZV64_50410 [Ignavibacteriales bacterium]|nr:hypothetical protein [Ignavibacteriales bacterium]
MTSRDSDHRTYTNCDNTGQKKLSVMLPSQEWIDKLQAYREVYFPELKVELKKSKLKDGIAVVFAAFNGDLNSNRIALFQMLNIDLAVPD